MLSQMLHQMKTRWMLARLLKAENRVKKIRAALNLHQYPHGRTYFGNVEVYRFDASGGYDTTRFLKDHPEVDVMLKTPAYQKPRVERVKVSVKD